MAHLYQIEHAELDEPPHPALGLLLELPADEAGSLEVAKAINDQLDLQSSGNEHIDIRFLDGELLELVQATGPPVFERARPTV